MSTATVFDVVSRAYATRAVDGAALKSVTQGRALSDVERQAIEHLQSESAKQGWKVDADTVEVFARQLTPPSQQGPGGMSWTRWDHTNMHVAPGAQFMYGASSAAQAMAAGAQAAVQRHGPSIGARAWGAAKGALIGTVTGMVGAGLLIGGAVTALAGGDWGTGVGIFAAAVGAKVGFWGGGIYGAVKAKPSAPPQQQPTDPRS